MEPLEAVASVIATVDLSAKVASLLFQYSKDVMHAKDDIERLQRETDSLKNVSESVQQLLRGPYGTRLEASQLLASALSDSQSQLEELDRKLTPGKVRTTMSGRGIGIRALKWPFESKEVRKIAQDLARCTQIISLSLQVDQTYAFVFFLGLERETNRS